VKFDEFRISIEPHLRDSSKWIVRVRHCSLPVPALLEEPFVCEPLVTRQDLDQLRNNRVHPDPTTLKELGQRVFQTMLPHLSWAYRHCYETAQRKGKGLRLTVSRLGTTAMGPPLAAGPITIGIDELPIEAAFHKTFSFIAASPKTPVSWAVAAKPDRDAKPVAAPLRVLTVISEPRHHPPVAGNAEKKAILKSLGPLLTNNAVVVNFCHPPTFQELRLRLQEGYHVLHFIGHGAFNAIPADQIPQPHLYFEDDKRRSRPVDGEQLYMALTSSNVPLVVLTACSTAAPSPRFPNHYPGLAFEGLAQALVERQAGPSAVVAMQFDIENEAARVFSSAFYEKLLTTPDCTVDGAAAEARSALLAEFGAHNRAWLTPSVYSRCRDGRVFRLEKLRSRLTNNKRAALLPIDTKLQAYRENQEDIASQKIPEIRAALRSTRQHNELVIQQLVKDRARVFGNLVSLYGGHTGPDGTIECVLTLSLGAAGVIDDARVSFRESTEFEFVRGACGRDVPEARFRNLPDLPLEVVVHHMSGGRVWDVAPEYEIATLTFRLTDTSDKSLYDIKLAEARIQFNGKWRNFDTQDGIVFGSEATAATISE